MLRDGNKDRLVVCSTVDGGNTVRTCGDTARDRSAELPIDKRVVQALEELEGTGVSGIGLSERLEFLDDDVRVADDEAVGVDGLGCSEVILIRVDEGAGLEVVEVQDDGEVLVRRDRVEVLRAHEFGRGHFGARGDDAHGCRVARTVLDLRAVSKRQVRDSGAEVDEVV